MSVQDFVQGQAGKPVKTNTMVEQFFTNINGNLAGADNLTKIGDGRGNRTNHHQTSWGASTGEATKNVAKHEYNLHEAKPGTFSHPGGVGHKLVVEPSGAWSHSTASGIKASGQGPDELRAHLHTASK